ncbi:Holliday junction branch migration protein RuvA [Trichlorobacter lovleyi]|jgi:Holliday junction DNA helicase subunit RuvA|uniref:Holliday junction branch migration complex subunit RuvA n=1 Tax=Trichlorobacter lovleyi (strain ATCC BAA-1151 / DSM 17278 / SZ) TaxID=398767 RepID=RUVA_TRIL1|nr:Holliday junction branch migration protein RuvA [Trichlorobacter lovleyi]B3E790.1 RecName: Full=Holliday junction branch migration complex subunit RuvA [Trichlorobacter lovleyi SZ]ACD94970.1 Holliday junction DNA helicase RuvA [Trichlorobacter lovleyi SZ]
MIALLTGQIAHKSPDHVILDVHGVGYRVMIPFSTYYELPEEGQATLHIHTSVREDAILLYGFRTRTEKSFFQLLISVSGIGPKLARDILSNIQPPQLAAALQQGDLHKLSAIPGIGKKTAERLVLELKDKAGKLDSGSIPAGDAVGRSLPAGSVLDDVSSALVNLGYKDPQVRKVLAELDCAGSASVEEVLKQALKILMK